MALELSINVSLSSNGKAMTFTETTGAYNVNLNPTGWGSPNLDLNQVLYASLVVTLPNTTSKTLFYTKGQSFGIAFASNFPDDSETYTFDITKALNSTYSLFSISGSGTQVTYQVYAPSHNFTTSSLLTTTGSSIAGYNITNVSPIACPLCTSQQFLIDLNTTIGSPVLTNPLAFSTNTTTEAFDDGVYKFVYTVKQAVTNTLYTDTFYLLVTTAVACCVDKLFHLASQSDCSDCKSEKLNKALEAESYLKAAEYAAACGKVNMAAKHLAKAQWICSEQNCLNC
jgi:hypothetical protein